MLNSLLLKAATKIINSPSPATYFITPRFINAKPGSTFSFYPLMIDELILDRNYADNFADILDLNMTISPKDYALLQDQGENLLCVLTITYVGKSGEHVLEPAPIQRQYNVMINNPEDIRKKVPDVHKYTEPSLKVSLRLIDPEIYELRHTKVNGLYPKMSIKDVLYAVTHNLGIERIHLFEPDNTHVYDHIDVGTYQSIDSVYNYLQSTCGVYGKGINSYLQDGCLYIYPPFETDIDYDRTTMFYQVDTGRFAGSDYFHKAENNSLSIVVNSQPTSIDLSIAGSENVGTGFIFNRASRLTDGFTTVDSNDGAQFTQDPGMLVTLQGSRTVTGSRNNIKHIHATDNPFPHMSELIAHQASLMTMTWMNADPFKMDPCQKLIYYYDKNGNMVQKTGIMEKAYYRFSRIKRVDQRDLFGCVGSLTLRLSPNETEVL